MQGGLADSPECNFVAKGPGRELEMTFFVPVANCRLIHLPREHERFVNILVPRSGYGLIDPLPLPVSPNAVRPPAVHASPDD